MNTKAVMPITDEQIAEIEALYSECGASGRMMSISCGTIESIITRLRVAELNAYMEEVEACYQLAQRLDANNPDLAGSFTGSPSERIKRQIQHLMEQNQ